jgi:hypothetical protein
MYLRFDRFAHLFQTKVKNIAHTLEGSNPASKDSSRRLRRLDVACILIWVFAPLCSLSCVHSAHCRDLSSLPARCTFCLPARESRVEAEAEAAAAQHSTAQHSTAAAAAPGTIIPQASSARSPPAPRGGSRCSGRWPRC